MKKTVLYGARAFLFILILKENRKSTNSILLGIDSQTIPFRQSHITSTTLIPA